MKAEQIEAIRNRAEKATKGPWYTASTTDGPWVIEENGNIISGTCARVSDGGFIAHAREDIPALLAEVERLRGVLTHIDELSDEFYTIEVIEGVPTFVLRPELEKFRDMIQEISTVSYEAVNTE